MDEQDVKDMADVTRKHAREEDADQRTPEGSHGFPSAAQDDDFQHLGQQGVGQTDDIHGKAPASGMTRQRANPGEQRDRETSTGDEEAPSGTDGGAES